MMHKNQMIPRSLSLSGCKKNLDKPSRKINYKFHMIHLVKRSLFVCGLCGLMLLSVAFAQQNVEGVVRDANGQPLAGVTVSISGVGGASVQTASVGGFQLTLVAPDTLVLSSVGFETVKLPAKPGEKIDCSLLDSA